MSPIDNKAALVQEIAWRRTGDKPLPEPMLTQFIDSYMRHSESGFIENLYEPAAHSVVNLYRLVAVAFCIFTSELPDGYVIISKVYDAWQAHIHIVSCSYAPSNDTEVYEYDMHSMQKI